MIVTSLRSWLAVQAQVCASAFITQNVPQLYPTTPFSTLETYPIMVYHVTLPGMKMTLGNGSVPIAMKNTHPVFTSLSGVRHVVLVKGDVELTSDAEGMYTCRIPDESNVQQTVNVGMYQTSTYENSSE